MAGVNTVISTTFNNKGIKQAESALDGFGKKVGPAIAGVAASLAAIGAGMAIRGLVDFTRQSIDSASNLEESINAVNVAFGDSAEAVLAIGENSANSLGVSTNEFNNAAVRFSAFAERVVGEGGDVAEFINDISLRATDFASVFNVDVAEALQVFQSGLAGEAEPLKRFGINLLQTEVAAYAVEAGIVASGESMTEAQKIQARYGLLMQETNKTAGDFANTSENLANRQRRLTAEMENLRGEVGSALLPVMESFVGIAVDDLVPVMRDLGTTLAPILADVLDEVAVVTKDRLVPAVEAFGDWMSSPEGSQAVEDFITNILNFVIGIVELTVAFNNFVNSEGYQNFIKPFEWIRDNLTIIGWGQTIINELGGIDGALLDTERQASNTAIALGNVLTSADIPASPTTMNRPENPKPGQVYTWFNYSGPDGQAVWYQQRWTGSEWTEPEKMTYSEPVSRGTGQSQADKIAKARARLLDQVAGLEDAFNSVEGISDRELGKFEQNVNKTFESVTDIIDSALSDDVINQRVAGQLGKIAKSARITALGIAREREAIEEDYERLLQKLDAARAVRESTKDQIAALANLKELGTMTREVVNDLGEVEEETTFTVDNIVGNLAKLLKETREFSKNLEALRKLGLDPRLFQQIVDSGVDAGGQTAEAIIEGGPEAVSEINSLFNELNNVGEEIGVRTSEVLYNGGESAIKGLLKGLRAQDRELANQAEEVATLMMSSLNDGITKTPVDQNSIIRQLKDMRDEFEYEGTSLGEALVAGITGAISDADLSNIIKDSGVDKQVSTGGTSSNIDFNQTLEEELQGLPDNIAEAIRKANLSENPRQFLDEALGQVTLQMGNMITSVGGSDQGIAREAAKLIEQGWEVISGSVPALAKGGIVRAPTLAQIGEQGPEAVIPLNKMGRMGSTYIINVNASSRTGGSQAGEEVVAALKTYNATNGDFNRALTGFGA